VTIRSGLRQSIRDELNDNAAVKLWTDALLNTYINEAIRAYSRELPKEASAQITVVADQKAYALPSDFDRAIRVEQPDDTIRVYDPNERSSYGYRIFASQLILDPAPTQVGASQDVTLGYLARYAEPSADGSTIEVPASDDDVLIRLACAMALQWISTDEAKRQRFERSRGASAMSMAGAYDADARRILNLRKRRVRTSALTSLGSSPAGPGVVLESSDPGP
jgi:hypothetical protein